MVAAHQEVRDQGRVNPSGYARAKRIVVLALATPHSDVMAASGQKQPPNEVRGDGSFLQDRTPAGRELDSGRQADPGPLAGRTPD
jgi:hypothetical protein